MRKIVGFLAAVPICVPMTRIYKGLFTVLIIGFCMSMSCFKWKTSLVEVFTVVTVTNKFADTLACQLITSIEQAKPFSLPVLDRTDFSKTNWVYSTLPVKRLSYASAVGLIFLVPAESKQGAQVYFLAIPKTDAVGVKMTAVEVGKGALIPERESSVK